MLQSLHIENLTIFPKADLTFGKNLNIFTGENGLGKTHLLKAIYAGIAASADAHFNYSRTPDVPPKTELPSKLTGVFRAERLLNLIHRRQSDPSYNLSHFLKFEHRFHNPELNLSLMVCTEAATAYHNPYFNTGHPNPYTTPYIEHPTPKAFIKTRPVFLPTRELLSLYPGFVSLYETTHLPFDETWRDTAILLGAPLVKGGRGKRIATLLAPIEAAMGGRLVLEDSGRFYLVTEGLGRIEMHLLAEGFRKLGMLARLIATGALLDSGFLFWDEPEANLNPKIIRTIAASILQLAEGGIQVFIASHSLFLLREIHILQQKEFSSLETCFFGLHQSGDGVEIRQGPTIDDVGPITALDEDLVQSERYMDSPEKHRHAITQGRRSAV